MGAKAIRVSSHVARDFLQNAAYFNTFPKIVWEYVSNSLDAARNDVPVAVIVDVTSDWLIISDDGKGMTRHELENFFQMHGENTHRKQGKRVRGRFGTGKSAAFGLANQLRIDTVQTGYRNVVELYRDDIDAATSGDAFPVRDVLVDEPTAENDGTLVEISDFNIGRPDVNKVINYIEHHLSRYRQRAHVTINGHECKFHEPQYVQSYECTPSAEVATHLGNVALVVKVSPIPLDDESNGIDILSYGIWHGTTLAGIEDRERANYLFGEIEIPVLEDGDWRVPAFDNTRNNTLNAQNPVVAILLGWIAEELERIRQELVDNERKRRKSEQAKQLSREAERIAEILNEDFAQLEMELDLARQVARRSGKRPVDEYPSNEGELTPGDGHVITPWQQAGHDPTGGARGKSATPGDTPRPGPSLIPGSQTGMPRDVRKGANQYRKAVFSIDYEHATDQEDRSRYERLSKTIWINLDHPQISGALSAGGGNIEGRQFRDVCYEVAAVEYALAVPYERLERDEHYEAADALYDVKDTINRVTRRFTQVL